MIVASHRLTLEWMTFIILIFQSRLRFAVATANFLLFFFCCCLSIYPRVPSSFLYIDCWDSAAAALEWRWLCEERCHSTLQSSHRRRRRRSQLLRASVDNLVNHKIRDDRGAVSSSHSILGGFEYRFTFFSLLILALLRGPLSL